MTIPPETGQHPVADGDALLARLDLIGRCGLSAAEKRRDLLATLKAAHRIGYEAVKRRCLEEKASGAAVQRWNCVLMDGLIAALCDHIGQWIVQQSASTKGEQLAVLAVGGYGRGELAPFSDVDLLFLIPYKITPYAERMVEHALYILWDMGLKVGHATRSIDECLNLARTDATIRTSLLDVRGVWGDKELTDALLNRCRAEAIAGSGIGFAEEKLAERDVRHSRHGDSRYLLEPNVKEGKGGLRDLHTLLWIARCLFGIAEIHELAEQGVVAERTARRFAKAQAFLWTVRCHLHFMAGRAEDTLTFDMQKAIAGKLGYMNRSGAVAVERFMRHYFLIAKDVGDLTRIFCALLEERHKRRPFFWLRQKTADGFVIAGNRIAFGSETAALAHPLQMLQLFRQAQINSVDIHPNALRLVAENRKIVGSLRNMPEANALFLDALMGKEPEVTLRRMNEASVLGGFIPEFGAVVAQMQYDMYHVYTTDEHSIRAIGVLNAFADALNGEAAVEGQVMKTIASRRALYVAVLFHDIAKGRGGDHSEQGARIVFRLGVRLGLSPEEIETVSWLVRHHLSMSRTAFKRDLDDPQTILNFAQIVQSPERLKLLFLLTCADIRAVGPKVWNGWKAALLHALYQRTEDVLSGGHAAEAQDARIERKKNALRQALADWPADDVEWFLRLGQPNYWLVFDAQTQRRHAEMARRAHAETLSPLIELACDPSRDVVELTVLAADHSGLFSQLAGAISVLECSIVDAKIVTLANGQALDDFAVQDPKGVLPHSEAKRSRLRQVVEDVLAGKIHLPAVLNAKADALPAKARLFSIPPRVILDNLASKSHTVLEVNGRDRPGFLYDVARTMTELGLQIVSAHISTYGTRVVDVFYVKDAAGMKIDHADKLKLVHDRLLKVLSEDERAGSTGAA